MIQTTPTAQIPITTTILGLSVVELMAIISIMLGIIAVLATIYLSWRTIMLIKSEDERVKKMIERMDQRHEEKMDAMRKEHEETIKYIANLIAAKSEEVKELISSTK